MAKNQGSNPKQNNQSVNLSDESFKEFLAVQKQKVQNEAKDLHLREREMDHSAKLAAQSLQLQAEHLKSKPGELRKVLWTFGSIGLLSLLIVMTFLAVCLYLGKDDFANTFWTGITYVATTLFGFLVGRKSKKIKGSNNRQPEAEVID